MSERTGKEQFKKICPSATGYVLPFSSVILSVAIKKICPSATGYVLPFSFVEAVVFFCCGLNTFPASRQ